MAEQRTATFSPETARTIARYVRDHLPKTAGRPPEPDDGKRYHNRQLIAKVTGNTVIGGVAWHSWIEVRFNPTTEVWEDVPQGESGTALVNLADPAASISNDTILTIFENEEPITGQTIWVGGSSGALPIGQYVGQTWIVVSNNSAAFAYPFAIAAV